MRIAGYLWESPQSAFVFGPRGDNHRIVGHSEVTVLVRTYPIAADTAFLPVLSESSRLPRWGYNPTQMRIVIMGAGVAGLRAASRWRVPYIKSDSLNGILFSNGAAGRVAGRPDETI